MSHSSTMTPERWQRLQTLFDEALTLEGQARADFIVNSCGDDVALREQLLSLIMASGSDDGFEHQVEQAIATTMLRDVDLPPGHVVGRYKIVRLLGRGGMGAVYLAERADKEFEQQVAIKIVADGALSNRIVARLRSERQILANLNHPNIARLLDGGATRDGTPYLAMEYVDGQRIDRYCEAKRILLTERLKLFQQVCAAVQYAHQQLVIHRDIKPSNILVTDDGTPKLLDFGIAKLVDPNATTEGMALTRLHERVLTPEHASPEQVRGEPVSTASDVYALGVLLYELLTGLKPFNCNGLSFEQIEKLIIEHVPLKPSAAVLAGSRQNVPTADASLAKELRGDLDTIVMKALHKEAARRYTSASALADDIAAFLNNRPIAARPDSFGYRAGKFARRNRWVLASAAAVATVVIGLTAFYTSRLAKERDNASVEAQKSKEIAQFLVQMFQSANPSQAQGAQLTALDLLDRGAQQIDARLDANPRVRAELTFVLGNTYKSLGSFERARELLERALALHEQQGTTRSVEYAQVLLELANAKRFAGDFAGAEQAFRQLLELQRRDRPGNDRITAEALSNLGSLYYEHNRNSASLALQQQALDMTIALYGEEHDQSADRMNNLALTLHALGDSKQAEHYIRRAVELRIGLLGPRHPATLTARYNLALLIEGAGRLIESEKHFAELLPLRQEVLGARHPSIGYQLTAHGKVLTRIGRYADAERALADARDILAESVGTEHRRYAAVLRNLGLLSLSRGRYAAALESITASRRIYAKDFGADDAEVLLLDVLAANALSGLGREAESSSLLATVAAQVVHSAREFERPTLLWTAVAELRFSERRWDDASAAFKSALAHATRYDQDHIDAAEPLLGLARLALAEDRPDAARSHVDRAIGILGAQVAPDHWQMALAESVAGETCIRLGENRAGVDLLSKAVASIRKSRPISDPLRRDIENRAALAERQTLKHAAPALTTL